MEGELFNERCLSGGRSTMKLALAQNVHSLGVNHVLMGILAVIMITAAVKYLKN
jgi:hypothetical protein